MAAGMNCLVASHGEAGPIHKLPRRSVRLLRVCQALQQNEAAL